MAIVEVQVRESEFLELVRTEFDRQRLPSPTLPLPGLHGKLLQRFRCDGLSVQPSAPLGQIGLATELVVEYNNNLDEVRAAGSMQCPRSDEFVMRPPLTVGVVVPDASTPDQAPLLRVSAFVPPLSFDVPMAIPEEFEVRSAAIAAGEGAVVVRLGTRSGDPVLTPIVSRVEESEWTQFISGAVFAETLTGVLEETLTELLSARCSWTDRPAASGLDQHGRMPSPVPRSGRSRHSLTL